MVYFTSLWRQAFRFDSLPFRLDSWLFGLPKGWKISFGMWVKYTVDSPGQPPSTFSVRLWTCKILRWLISTGWSIYVF